MTVVTIDIRELTGDETLLGPDDGQVWFTPYLAYHVEDGAEDYLVSTEILKLRLVDGIAAPELPETPVDNLMKVQLRGIRGYGAPWYVQIPATECNLFDLPHIDPDTLDPIAPPSPAWLAALEAEETARIAEDEALAAAIAAAEASDVDSVAGLSGAVTADGLKTALDLPTNTVVELGLKADQTALDGTDAALLALTDIVDDKADAAATTAALAGKQPLDADLTAFAALAPTDGQLLAYNSTLGAWTVTNPVGASLNAAAINNTGTSTAFTSVAATIPGTAISVTNSGGRTVALEFEGCFQQTVVGTGLALLMVYETTGGANTFRMASKRLLSNSTVANLANLTWDLNRLPIGVVTTTRTFELRAIILVASGTPGASTINSATNPTILEAHNQ